MSARIWTPEAVRALGVRTDLPTAGEILGLNRAEAYRMNARGEFPVPVVKVGRRRLVVPTAPIIDLLRISAPDMNVVGPASPVPATKTISAATPVPRSATPHDPISGR